MSNKEVQSDGYQERSSVGDLECPRHRTERLKGDSDRERQTGLEAVAGGAERDTSWLELTRKEGGSRKQWVDAVFMTFCSSGFAFCSKISFFNPS